MGISQSSLSRIIGTLKKRGEILTLGAARSTQYALLSPLKDDQPSISVYQIDNVGHIHRKGFLHCLASNQYGWSHPDSGATLLESLPHWIQNMRPEGFMGRALAHKHAEALGLPSKLQIWTEQHMLYALSQIGEDVPGNLILGDIAIERYLDRASSADLETEILSADTVPAAYIQLAEQALAGEPTGSSAGGEQPKFTAIIAGENGPEQVIVKFTKTVTDEGRRWSDLLVAEHIANHIMRDAGYITAETRIIQEEGWTFLESIRFDRNGLWGRLPLVSLATLDAEYVGELEGWVSAVEGLHTENRVLTTDVQAVQWLNVFGECIGNTDRHLGNISFIPDPDGEIFHLAPVYDMTPMFYRPKDGGQMQTGPIQPRAKTIQTSIDQEALESAKSYWEAILDDSLISADFKEACKENIATLDKISAGPRIQIC